MSKVRHVLGGLILGLAVFGAPIMSWGGVVVFGPSSSLPNGTIEVALVVDGTGLFADAITITGLTFDSSLVVLAAMTPSAGYADNLVPGGLPSVPLFTFVATEELPPGRILTWAFVPKGPPIPPTSLVSVNVLVESITESQEFNPSTPLNPIPEPQSTLMLLAGLGLLVALRMTRRLD